MNNDNKNDDPVVKVTAYVSYDKANKEMLKKQLQDCRDRGVLGEQVDDKVTRARLQHVGNVVALQTALRLFPDEKKDGKFKAKMNNRIEQERRWIKHYDDCLVEHRKGRIKKRDDHSGFNILTMLAIQEQLKTEAENERNGRSKIVHEDRVGTVRPATPATSSAKRKNGYTNGSGPKMGRDAWKAAESAKRLAARQANGGHVGPK